MPTDTPTSRRVGTPAAPPDHTMLHARLSRRRVLGLFATVAVIPVAAACGGGNDDDATATVDGDGTPESTDPPVVMSTFTPQPPTPTPGASPTGGTATPQGTPDAATTPPSGPVAGEPTPTQAPNEVRAPLVTLRSANGSTPGWVSEFTWYDPELESIGGIFAPPYSTLPPESLLLLVAPDEAIELSVAHAPFPVTAATIDLYPAEENIAIPTDPAGNPLANTLSFVPQTGPVLSDSFTSLPANVANDLPLGRYIAEVRVDWTLPSDVAAQVQRPVYVICVAMLEIV